MLDDILQTVDADLDQEHDEFIGQQEGPGVCSKIRGEVTKYMEYNLKSFNTS